MAAKNTIKGITVEIGGDTTKLGDALEKVVSKSIDLSGELKEVNKLLKLDPGNTDLLAQKQEILTQAVANTTERLKTLKDAEKQVQEQFKRGEVSEAQVRALQREIISTESALKSYEKAARDTADKVKGLGDDTTGAAKDTKKAEDAADKAADSLDDLADSADKAGDAGEGMGSKFAGAAKAGLGAVAGAATAALGGLVGAAEATREYRTAMGKLETAFTTAGHSAETAAATYGALQGVLGETDQAVEAANHLAKLTDNEEDLATWTDIATGVYATFGDSLPIEGLTEAANETAKTGAITGGLADALNWAAEEGETFGVALKENISFTELSGKELEELTDAQRAEYEARKAQYTAVEAYNQKVSEATSAEDLFNIALENCTTEQERQALITETLNGMYSDAAAAYRETNAEIIRANEANEAWTASLAEVGASVEPILTDVKMLGASLLSDLLPGITDVTDAFRELLSGDAASADDLGEALSDIITELLEKVADMAPMLLQVATSLITSLAQSLIAMLPTLLQTLIDITIQVINALSTSLPQIVTAIMAIVPQLIQQLIAAIPQLLQAAITFLMAIVDALPTIITSLIEALPDIIDTVIDALLEAIPMLIDAAIQLFMAIMEALPVIIAALTENLPRIIDTIIDGLLDALPLLLDGAIELMMAIVEAIPIIIPLLVEEIPGLVRSLIKALVDRLPDLIKGAVKLLMGIVEAIPQIIIELGKQVPTIIISIVKGLKDGISDMAEVGLDLVKGLWNGIKDAGAWILEKIKGFAGDIVDGIKGFFGIASPSKVFRDQIGKNLALGMAEGIEDNADAPLDAMSDLSDDLLGQAGEMNGLTFERNLNTTFGGAQAAEAQNGLLGKLDKILDAIEKGQFITLDGNLLVGGTLDLIDAKLGQRRIMAARGAL